MLFLAVNLSLTPLVAWAIICLVVIVFMIGRHGKKPVAASIDHPNDLDDRDAIVSNILEVRDLDELAALAETMLFSGEKLDGPESDVFLLALERLGGVRSLRPEQRLHVAALAAIGSSLEKKAAEFIGPP